MARLFALALALTLSLTAHGQHEGDGALVMDPVNNDVTDIASLQRGAKYFVNYCLGCHSAQYVRYNRLAEDLGLSEPQLIENLMFTGERPFDTLQISMRPEDGIVWFGIAPPDLSLVSRSLGTDYLYNYLRGFYVDESAPSGANNLWLENTAMPHVLWEIGGIKRAIFAEADVEGTPARSLARLEVVREGTLSEGEFDQVVQDIVNFLDYIGEPVQSERREIGIRVIAFLLIFLLISYMLKREIWKDVD